MAWRLEVTQGGEVSAPVVDFTSQIPMFEIGDGDTLPQIKMGMEFDDGGASMSTILVDDDTGEMPKADGTKALRAHNLVRYIENVGGTDYWLSVGWIAPKEIGRNPDYFLPDARQWSVQVEDANAFVRGIGLTADTSRPAETGWERMEWLATTYLDGDPSVTTVITFDAAHKAPNTNTFDMPAADYQAGTLLGEIIADCTESEGKTWGVIIHHSGGSHLCLQYITPLDHTTNLSALKISDVPADHDLTSTTVPVVPPAWDQGAATIEDGQELPTALVYRYGQDDKFVYVEDTTLIAKFGYYLATYFNDRSLSAAQATAKAENLLNILKNENTTHQPTIRLHRTQIHLIGAGMSVQIKSAAALGGEHLHSYQTRRVVDCIFEPASAPANAPEWYTVYLKLDRPRRFPGKGRAQPSATTPKPAPQCQDDPAETEIVTNADVLWPGTYPVTRCSITTMHNVGASGGSTSHIGCTAGNGYVLHLTVCGTDHDYNVRVRFYDDPTAGSLISTYGPVSIGTIATGTVEDHDVSFTAPALAQSFVISLIGKLGGWNYQGTVGETPAGTEGDDPFCVDYDGEGLPHDSPYYLPSDTVLALFEEASQPHPYLIAELTNKSGATRNAGDLVIVDTANDSSFTTTTTANLATRDFGIVYEEIADNATGKVLLRGQSANINLGGATPTRGHYIFSTTVAGQAATSATRAAGAVGQVIEAAADGGVLFWGTPDGSSGGGGNVATDTIWDAKGDLAAGTGANTAAVLTVGANDTILMADSAQTTGLKWVASATPSTQAFGDAAAVGTADTFTRGDHKHAMPATPSLDTLSNVVETSPANGDALAYDGTDWDNRPQYVTIPVVLGGAGTVLVTGEVLGLKITVPFKCTVLRYDLFADVSGSVVLDIWKDTYANFPPANGDSITASAKPTLSSARNAQSSTLTGWTTTINADDVLAFEVESVTTVTQVTLNLICKRIY